MMTNATVQIRENPLNHVQSNFDDSRLKLDILFKSH